MLKELFPGSADFKSGHFQNTPNIKTFFGYAIWTVISMMIYQVIKGDFPVFCELKCACRVDLRGRCKYLKKTWFFVFEAQSVVFIRSFTSVTIS